jgi:tRNA pseudouridine55 synthase
LTFQFPTSGILPCNKPSGKTSFSLVAALRKKTGVRKIGHAGTLDPFADGVMILLIGREFTRQAGGFVLHDKEYEATLHIGLETTTYDPEGEVVFQNGRVPSLQEIEQAVSSFQGTILQTPPMFSAKKVGGKRLYELARRGVEIKRSPVPVTLQLTLLHYVYPLLKLHITCSKGTYIRSLAHDIGAHLGTGAYLQALTRLRSGPYRLSDCIDGQLLFEKSPPTLRLHLPSAVASAAAALPD